MNNLIPHRPEPQPVRKPARSTNLVVGVGSFWVSSLATTKVDSLISCPNVLRSIAKHMVQTIKLRLHLRLCLSLVDSLRHVYRTVVSTTVGTILRTQLDQSRISFAQLTVKRLLVVASNQSTGFVAISTNVFRQLVTAFQNAAVNASNLLSQDHRHSVNSFFDTINTGSQGTSNVVQLRNDASRLQCLRRFHSGSANSNSLIYATDSRHKRHIGLVLFSAVAVTSVIAVIPVMITVHQSQQQPFSNFCHVSSPIMPQHCGKYIEPLIEQ